MEQTYRENGPEPHKFVDLSLLTGSASWLAVIGAAFYWSWMDNAMFSGLLLTGLAGDNALVPLGFAITLGASIAALLVLLALKPAARISEGKGFFPLPLMIACATGGPVMCLATALSSAFGLPHIAMIACAGAGLAVGAMQVPWGRIAIAQGPRKALAHTAGAWACGFFLNMLIENLIAPARVAFVATLPLLSLCAYLVNRRLQNHPLYRVSRTQNAADPWKAPDSGRPRTIFGVDRCLPFYALVFCLGFGFMYSLSVLPSEPESLMHTFEAIGSRGLTATVLFTISLTPLSRRMDKVFTFCLSLMVIGVLAMTLEVYAGHSQSLAGMLIPVGYAGFDILIWTLMAYFALNSNVSLTRVIALVMGAEQVGIFTGHCLGIIVQTGTPSWDGVWFIAFLYVFLMAALGLTRLSGRLWEDTGRPCGSLVAPAGTESLYPVDNQDFLVLPDTQGSLQATESSDASQRTARPQIAAAPQTAITVEEAASAHDVAAAESPVATDVEATREEPSEPGAACTPETATYLDALAAHFSLTSREQDILTPFAEGRSVPYIAGLLVVSENTVKTHVRHIYTKCGVHNRQEMLDIIAEYRERGTR